MTDYEDESYSFSVHYCRMPAENKETLETSGENQENSAEKNCAQCDANSQSGKVMTSYAPVTASNESSSESVETPTDRCVFVTSNVVFRPTEQCKSAEIL